MITPILQTNESNITIEQSFLFIDPISSILNLDTKNEIEQRIDDNITKLNTVLNYVINQLKRNRIIALNQKYKELFIQSLKFIYTLNLFIPDIALNKLMSQIRKIAQLIQQNKSLQSKDFMLNQIKHVEISLIYVSKKTIYDLFFVKDNKLPNKILKLIELVNPDHEDFDAALYKQIQNIIVNDKLGNSNRLLIHNKMNKLKENSNDHLRVYPNHYSNNNNNSFKPNVSIKDTQQTKFGFKKKIYKRSTKSNIEIELPLDDSNKENVSVLNQEDKDINYNNDDRVKVINNNQIIANTYDKSNRNKYDNPKSNIFQESLQSIEPKLLHKIKAKLSETNYNSPLSPSCSYDYFNIFLSSAIYCYQNTKAKIGFESKETKTNSDININPLIDFLCYAHDFNLHKEYILLKSKEYTNPTEIASNITLFEDQVLIPFYKQSIYFISQSNKQYRKIKNIYKKLIMRILSKDNTIEFTIKPYGSLINSFRLDKGDIDLCIITDLTITEFTPYFINLTNELKVKRQLCTITQSLISKKALLLSVLDIQSNIFIDISFHDVNPEFNSNMIRFYSIYDQRFHIMGLYLKNWAKINKAHGSSEGYLSSYALLLLLISFLQKINPPVLPYYLELEDKIQCCLCQNKESDKHQQDKYMNKNNESVGQLLIRFFEYYSYFFDYNYKISIGSSIEVINISDTAFSIVDYFDPINDPGKSMKIYSNEYRRFITLMKQEINYISKREYVDRIPLE